MPWFPPRFSLVPWLGAPDLEPQGLPDATIERGNTITHVMRVPNPFGRYTSGYVIIAADRQTKAITTWITHGEDDGADDTFPQISINTDDDEDHT